MASIKNLKSQGKAYPDGQWSTSDYLYRKRQFADRAPAKVVKPVRALKHHLQKVLAVWEREADAFNNGVGKLPVYPRLAEAAYHTARKHPDMAQSLAKFFR